MAFKDNIMMLWSTPIGVFYNENHHAIKNDLIDFFKKYKNNNPKSRKGDENIKLYESNYNIHTLKNPSYEKLMFFFAESFKKISEEANKEYQNKNNNNIINIKDSWFIIYESNGFVAPHVHSNCSWSSVYYVQCDEDNSSNNGETYLQKPFVDRLKHDNGSRYLQFETRNFEPKEGLLIIWPSHIIHGSFPYTGEKKRIIVSANATIQKKKE